MRVEEKTDLFGMPALVLNVVSVGADEVYFVENEWDYNDSEPFDEALYTQAVGKYVRMKRLLPGEQVIMTLPQAQFAAFALGDKAKPTTGGLVVKVP